MNTEPLVTIVCITYNHAPYVAKAIESFLMQQTSFEFDILIHDDASTDETPGIINEYIKKHPGKIRAILQTENQYSKDVHIWEHICFPEVHSRYIAICEGDDFWNDTNKLQQQIDQMENNPDISMTCCNSYIVTHDEKILKTAYPFKSQGYIKAADIINSSRSMVATCSLVFRRDVLSNRQDFYDKTITGDYPLEVLCATNGKVYYFEIPMVSYRSMVPGSWSKTIRTDKTNRKQQLLAITTSTFLLDVNTYTDRCFSSSVYGKITRYLYGYIKSNGDTKEEKYQNLYKRLPLKYRIILSVCSRYPNLIDKVKRFLRRKG